VTLFPSVLALSEWRGKTGNELLTAYLIGFRAGSALGSFAGLSHYMAGWHGTSTIGHLASVSACSRLLGLDEGQTTHALGIAATQASGLKRVFGTMCKPFHAGKCSQAGLNSALMAGEGFTSAEDALEGPQGFFDVLGGDKNEEVLENLGRTWDIEALAQKYHASCHATHSPIEAAWKIVNEQGLSPDRIKSITVKSSETALSAAHRVEAASGLEGKFSIPYCVANALLRGNTGMQAFVDERVSDPAVQAFMKKIILVRDEKKVAMEADVELETADGMVYSASSDIFQEVPPLEVKKEKLRAKFEDLCGPVLGDRKTEEIRDAILSLDTLEDIGVLFAA
jgi:2-methylcitrate dehydratase PrpD